MSVREHTRPFIQVMVGNGMDTNAWEDWWIGNGNLASQISYRQIHAQGYTPRTTVKEFLDGRLTWPAAWLDRAPQLDGLPLPNLSDQRDSVWWVANNTLVPFSVQHAYASMDGEHEDVLWSSVVWSKGHIPKHAFCLWLACLRRLPTQDRLASWKHEPPDWRCSLCETCMDSHTHLFFECSFSNAVWKAVTLKLKWENAPDTWDLLLGRISQTPTQPKLFEHKIGLAASVYMVWRERNSRLFTSNKRTSQKVVQDILEVVQLRAAWKKMQRKAVISDVEI